MLVTEVSHDGNYYVGHNKSYDQVCLVHLNRDLYKILFYHNSCKSLKSLMDCWHNHLIHSYSFHKS